MQATDAAVIPNVGLPASRSFTVETGSTVDPPADPPDDPPVADVTPPETEITKAPRKTSHKRRARFTFTSNEPGSTFECKLDRKPFKACASPLKKKVKLRRHRFQVRAIDAAGNVDQTPAKAKFRILRPA